MRPIWVDRTLALLAAAVLAGCATNSEKLRPRDEHTMLDIWQHETDGAGDGQTGRLLLDARQGLANREVGKNDPNSLKAS